jgi:iron complex transport system substrate-binding protein
VISVGVRRKECFIILVFVLSSLLLGGCTSDVADSRLMENKIFVTDVLGRTVEIDKEAKRVVTVGPGALRLCCYFNNISMIVGVEQIDKDITTGKSYLMAYPELANLPVIGQGGPNNSPDAEKILTVAPDIIFSTYATDKTTVDKLQSKIGVPVIAIGYGASATFDYNVYTSLRLIGKTTGMEQKAEEIIGYMESCKNDLYMRTKEISDDGKSSVYVGGLGMKGAHGIESTQAKYSLFDAVNAKNVVDEIEATGTLMIDKEKLIEWNPDKIFIDLSGFELILQDYKKNPSYYNALSAFKNCEVYSLLPYNFYSTNIDTAIADAYYIGKVLYPEKFADIDPVKKADEIYKTLLNKELYNEMAEVYRGFSKLAF